MRPIDEQVLARHRRATLRALSAAFPHWAFVYDEITGRWVAAPGHPLTPRLRVLRSSARIEAATASELRAQLDAR